MYTYYVNGVAASSDKIGTFGILHLEAISICPATQISHLRIHASKHKTKGGFEVDHLSVNCRRLHDNRSSVFKFMVR